MVEKNGQKDFVIEMPVYPRTSNSEGHHDSQENLTLGSSTSPTSPLSDDIVSPNLNKSQERDKDTTPSKPRVEDEDEDEKIQDDKESANWDKWTWLVVFEWIVLVCCTGCIVASLTIDRLKNHVIWGSELWKCVVLVLVFFCSQLLTRWMINIAVFLMSSKFVKQFVRREKVLYFVHGVWKSVWLCTWVFLVLLTWVLLFPHVNRVKRSEKEKATIVNLIRRVLFASLLGTLIWLGKSVLVKILASKFQGKRFFCRIRAAILHQHIIEVLNRPNLPQAKINPVIVKWISKFGGMKKASAWTINGFIKVINGSMLVVADADSVNKAATQIFKNLVRQKSKGSTRKIEKITKDDLLSYFDRDKEIEQVLQKKFKNEEITESAFAKWLEKIYDQRNSLTRSLTDSKTAIEELERLANVIMLIVILIVWFYQMRILTTQALIFISSQLLLLTFMFGNTLKTVFEAIIFVFVVHPFNVHDYCVIDEEELLVDEMNLNTTIFLKDGKEKIYYPNSVLAGKPIRVKINNLVVKDFDDHLNKIKLGVYFTHTGNVQDYGKKRKRRSNVVLKQKEILESRQIKFHFRPKEAHSD